MSLLVFLALGSADEGPDDWKSEDNSNMSYIMMKDFVKQRLKAPSTAIFPEVLERDRDNHVRSLGDHKYHISSYVDAQNSFGAMMRTRFEGEIQQISKDQWQLLSLQLIE